MFGLKSLGQPVFFKPLKLFEGEDFRREREPFFGEFYTSLGPRGFFKIRPPEKWGFSTRSGGLFSKKIVEVRERLKKVSLLERKFSRVRMLVFK